MIQFLQNFLKEKSLQTFKLKMDMIKVYLKIILTFPLLEMINYLLFNQIYMGSIEENFLKKFAT